MKLILAICLCITIASCGGSSSGGGGNNDNIICGSGSEKCARPPFSLRKASSLRTVSKDKVIELITAVESKLTNVKEGQTYLKVDQCIIKAQGQVIQERVLKEYTILGFDKGLQEVRAHVRLTEAPQTDYCFDSEELEDKEYIAIIYVPTADEAPNMLDFDSFAQGIINGNPAIVGKRTSMEDGFNTKVEFGMNLNMPYVMGTYLEVDSKGSMGEGLRQRFNIYAGEFDISDIDTTGLEEVYEYIGFY